MRTLQIVLLLSAVLCAACNEKDKQESTSKNQLESAQDVGKIITDQEGNRHKHSLSLSSEEKKHDDITNVLNSERGNEKRARELIRKMEKLPYERHIYKNWKNNKKLKISNRIKSEDKRDSLVVNGKNIYTARSIFDFAKSGSDYYVVATLSDLKHVERQDAGDYIFKDGIVQAAYNDIYKIDKHGKVEKLNQDHEHVRHVIANNSGPWIAYVRKLIDISGQISSNEQIVFMNIKDGVKYVGGVDEEFSMIAGNQQFDIIPLKFAKNSVQVIFDWGETGGHKTLYALDLEK